MANSFDAMKVATESLADSVHRKATHNSLWLNAIPRGAYANNTGLTQTTFTVENSMPTDDTETWDAIALSTGSDTNFGACADSFTDAEVGFSERTYSPEKFQLRGPIICETDLLFQHNPRAFLTAYVDELAKRSKKSWENKLANEYVKFAEKIVVSSTSTLTVDSTIAAPESLTMTGTSAQLLPAHLNAIAARLIENGATEGDSNGWITLDASGPVFPLIIGMEHSEKLAGLDSTYRDNLRYGEPNELLKRLGASRVLGNFRHVPVTMPMRFTESGGVYTRIDQWTESSATKGKKYAINSAWKTATHEAAIVLNPAVMTAEIVKPEGYGLSFDAKNYSGDWKWVTGGDKIGSATATSGNDPLEKLARHYATYMSAFRPVRPEDGCMIIFDRDGS
tara:strand:- start:8754 stop:9935 length:1182 start_codon:yes stop_codon:yes gene_type:complete